MLSRPFLYFLTLDFFKEHKKHIGVIAISLIILFLLSSVLFISSSIRYSLKQTLSVEPDVVVQRIQGGQRVDAPLEWMDRLLQINGVRSVTPRVYGRYFFKPKGESCLIVGVDFMDEQSHKELQKIIETTDIKSFLSKENMLVGEGVSKFLKAHFYNSSYTFLTPSGAYKKVDIFKVLPSKSNLIANDMVIVSTELAQEILGIGEDEVSDIVFDVPNKDELDNIVDKTSALYYDVRVVTKRDVSKAYENLYNYKGGIFLILFLITLATFVLILYQRYSMVYSDERRNIGLLRALGWSIRDVLKLKFFEAMIVVVIAYILGIVLAYLYVFVFGAPLLREIFLGGANLHNSFPLVPILDFQVLSTIFLIYAIAFVSAVLIPVWKIAVTSPKEAML